MKQNQYCFTLQVFNSDLFIFGFLFGDFLVENTIMRHLKCIFNIILNANIAVVIANWKVWEYKNYSDTGGVASASRNICVKNQNNIKKPKQNP